MPGLSASRLRCTGPIWIRGTSFSASVDMTDAHIIDVSGRGAILKSEQGSHLHINLSGAQVEHDVDFTESKISGSIVAAGARVKGSLVLAGSVIEAEQAIAIYAKLIRIGGNIIAQQNFRCSGASGIILEGGEVDGAINLREANLYASKGDALNLDHAVVNLGVHAADLKAVGAISMHHATVSCQISFSRGSIEVSEQQEYAIRADHVVVHGSILLNGGLTTTGRILLHGAQIECTLNMHGIRVRVQRDDKIAIDANGATIGGNINASQADVQGALWLDSTDIGGRVRLGGKWTNPRDGLSINLNRAKMNSLTVMKKLDCEGTVSIAEANVNGTLDISDSTIGRASSKSLDLGGTRVAGDVTAQRSRLNGVLDAPRSEIKGDLRLADAHLIGTPAELASRGEALDQQRGGQWRGASLRLRGAHILGDLDLRGAVISQTLDLDSATIGYKVDLRGAGLEADSGRALTASNSRISLLDMRIRSAPQAAVNLQNAHIDILTDNAESWPTQTDINLEGLQYRQLDSELSSHERLTWLATASPQFSPQPYEQLASVYKARGNTDDERAVRLEAAKRSYVGRGVLPEAWGQIQNAIVGFGYRPFRAVIWAVGLWLAGTAWFMFGAEDCDRSGLVVKGLCPLNDAVHPIWKPPLLSIDLISPFSTFGQDGAWELTGISVWVGVGLTLSGWLLLTTIAAALARNLKH